MILCALHIHCLPFVSKIEKNACFERTTNNEQFLVKNKIEIYQNFDGEARIEVTFSEDTVWLNRNQLSELFGRDVKTLGKHINNIFEEGELEKSSVVANFATTAADVKYIRLITIVLM